MGMDGTGQTWGGRVWPWTRIRIRMGRIYCSVLGIDGVVAGDGWSRRGYFTRYHPPM